MGDNFFKAYTFAVSAREIIFRCDFHPIAIAGTITVE